MALGVRVYAIVMCYLIRILAFPINYKNISGFLKNLNLSFIQFHYTLVVQFNNRMLPRMHISLRLGS